MRVGSMFLGEVENLDHESIKTKFFILGVPLFPMESFYATSDDGNSVRGLPIELHPASVAAGYLRLGTGLAAFLFGLFAWLEWRSYDPQYTLAGLAVLSALAWVPSMFWLGALSTAEKERRRRLRLVAGVGAPPELLSDFTRQELAEALVARWHAAGGEGDWRARLSSGEAGTGELVLLWAIAEYHRDAQLIAFAAEFLKAVDPGAELLRLSA
jgi:hypothetical protein